MSNTLKYLTMVNWFISVNGKASIHNSESDDDIYDAELVTRVNYNFLILRQSPLPQKIEKKYGNWPKNYNNRSTFKFIHCRRFLCYFRKNRKNLIFNLSPN